jgi:hypothetical protein
MILGFLGSMPNLYPIQKTYELRKLKAPKFRSVIILSYQYCSRSPCFGKFTVCYQNEFFETMEPNVCPVCGWYTDYTEPSGHLECLNSGADYVRAYDELSDQQEEYMVAGCCFPGECLDTISKAVLQKLVVTWYR